MSTRSVLDTGALGRNATLAAMLGLWVAALFLPAIMVPGGPALSGLDVLVRGWRALDAGVYAWLANPLFMAAWVSCWRRRYVLAGTLSGVGAVLALTSFAAAGLARSVGSAVPDVTLAAGFYLWLAAQLGILAVAWISEFRTRYTAKT